MSPGGGRGSATTQQRQRTTQQRQRDDGRYEKWSPTTTRFDGKLEGASLMGVSSWDRNEAQGGMAPAESHDRGEWEKCLVLGAKAHVRPEVAVE